MSTAGGAATRAIQPQQKIADAPILRPTTTTSTMVRKAIGLTKAAGTSIGPPLEKRKQVYLYVYTGFSSSRQARTRPNF